MSTASTNLLINCTPSLRHCGRWPPAPRPAAGLLHAKTLVVDDALALVGSANMDRRSLDLNFENNVLFESAALAAQVGEHQRRWLADSIEIDEDGVALRSLPRRFVDNLLTMAAPLF